MKHGTLTGYSIHKCRCTECKKKWNDYYRPRTKARQEAILPKLRAARDAEKAHPCMDCGGTFPPECMDWDHRPDEDKLFNIGPNILLSKEKLDAEKAKCDLICANCHRIRTKKRKELTS